MPYRMPGGENPELTKTDWAVGLVVAALFFLGQTAAGRFGPVEGDAAATLGSLFGAVIGSVFFGVGAVWVAKWFWAVTSRG